MRKYRLWRRITEEEKRPNSDWPSWMEFFLGQIRGVADSNCTPTSDKPSICKLSATFCKDINPHRCWLKRRSSNLSRWIPHREGTFWPFRTDMVGRENGFRSRLTAEVEGQPRILTLSDVLVAHGLPSCVAIRSSAEDAKCCPRARGCFPLVMWKRSAAAHGTSSSKDAGRQLSKA